MIEIRLPGLRIGLEFVLQGIAPLRIENRVRQILQKLLQVATVDDRARLIAISSLMHFPSAARMRKRVTRSDSTGRPHRAAK